MSTAMSGEFGAGTCPGELTVGALAGQADQALRAINHLTRPDGGGLTYPGEACELIAELAGLTGRLPQLLGQLAGWLHGEARAGRLRVDACCPLPDPAATAAAVIADLTEASGRTRRTSRVLDSAHQRLAHLAAAGDLGDEPERS